MIYAGFSDNNPFYFHHDDVTVSDVQKNEAHYHNFFEIYFIESGSCNYFIGNRSYQLISGDLILIPDGIIHNTIYRNSRHSRMLINCSHRFIPSVVIPYLPSMLYLYRNPEITDEVYTIFRNIEKEYMKNDHFSEEIMCCYTHMLFCLLARNKNTYEESMTRKKYIEDAILYIQSNFSADLTLHDMAKMFYISPEQFSRVFKKETGFGFNKYLNILRLQNAERLLKQTNNLSVADIATRCGFNDSNYFSSKFREMYGISPKKMQMNLKEK